MDISISKNAIHKGKFTRCINSICFFKKRKKHCNRFNVRFWLTIPFWNKCRTEIHFVHPQRNLSGISDLYKKTAIHFSRCMTCINAEKRKRYCPRNLVALHLWADTKTPMNLLFRSFKSIGSLRPSFWKCRLLAKRKKAE